MPEKIYKYRLNLALFLLFAFLVWGHIPLPKLEDPRGTLQRVCFAQSPAEEQQNPEGKDIQWFRDEMKISPKYVERKEGVLGMSWTHFFTMLFLVLFFIGAVAAMIIRHKRAKELLNRLMEEGRHGTAP